MASDGLRSTSPDDEHLDRRTPGRFRGALRGTRALIQIAYRDPEHVAERLALHASQHLGEASRAWATQIRETQAGTPRATLAEELRTQSAMVARVDGAVAGTPFLIALVPGYMAYLQQEARMTLRVAALYGRDPAELRTVAEMLALRGVHPTPDAAEAALRRVRSASLPDKPSGRRPLGTWVHSAYLLLVVGGFISAPDNDVEQVEKGHPRLRALAGIVTGVAIWVSTWVFPVTFMIVMAWGCESHTRQLGRRVLSFYDGEVATTDEAIETADQHQDKGHDKRAIVRRAALAVSVLVPILFVAYVDSLGGSTGVGWLGAVGALVALSLVIAVAMVASRR
jgi:hypothetical protein